MCCAGVVWGKLTSELTHLRIPLRQLRDDEGVVEQKSGVSQLLLCLFLSSPSLGWVSLVLFRAEGRGDFPREKAKREVPAKEALGRQGGWNNNGQTLPSLKRASRWEQRKRKTCSLFLALLDIQEAGEAPRGGKGQKKGAGFISSSSVWMENFVPCALINRSFWPLGSNRPADTMNNSPSPLALVVTWQRGYN